MPFQDFRQFLDVLRQHGELIDINRPIALNDVGKAMKQSYVRNGPAIMFNNNGTDYPLVAGVYSTREKALLAFEADETTIFEKVLHGLDNPIPSTVVSGAAPCHEEIIEGDAIDIREFSGAAIQSEGWRRLHYAGHRRLRGSRNRRAGCRALPVSHSRQGHGLVLGAAVPSISARTSRNAKSSASCRRRRW